MTRHTIVVIVGVLAAASISVAAGWAQPRETRVLPGPMTERLFHLANCKATELEACKGSCASNDKTCTTACEAKCALER
jgi:hypothetical protein